MSITAAKSLGLPPGFSFRPDASELVELYLLPRVRGEPAPFPGVAVIEDDSAANTLPWRLLKRHGLLDDDDQGYFLVHTSDAKNEKEAARQDRYCEGYGTWVSQRPVVGCSCVGGQEIKWRQIGLNLHKGRGKNGSGSTGWVMHEYSVTEPACPSLKICHISFTGHGKDRKRVPDDCQAEAGEPVPKRARVEADASSNNGSWTDEGYGMDQYASGDKEILDQNALYVSKLIMLETILFDEGYGTYNASGDVEIDQEDEDLYQELEAIVQEVQADQPSKQEPTIQTTISDQEPLFPTDQGISPSNQHLLDGTYLPTTDQEIQEAQLQPAQTSFPFAASAGAEFYLPTIQQELLQQAQELDLELFWSTDNIIV